jgi:lipopolysaccharide transport system ATP-binding protein
MGGVGNPNLTGREYAQRYLRLMGARRRELEDLLTDILDFSELEESFDQKIHTYSSGMAARLYFATATALQQEIYLIDELLSEGDEHFQAKCWQRMRDRLLHGSSGILVTHDWASILKLCESSHVVERGRIVHSGSSDKIVVSYLNLPIPQARGARFSSDNSDTYVARSGEDSEFRFVIEIDEPAPVAFAYSIEMLRIGIGWEVILLSDAVPVASAPGRHELVLTIPRLPIAPGQYSLNVFLSRQKMNAQESTEGYDMRSWTLGNGWHLIVLGESIDSTTKLPVSVGQWTDD